MVVRPANGNDSLYVPKAQYEATRTSLEQDCEAWRKAGIKQQKERDTLYKAFWAFISNKFSGLDPDKTIAEWVDNEEQPL